MDALIEQIIMNELKKYIVAGKKKFVICPWGEWGHYVQAILRKQFGINEVMVLDNGIEGKEVKCLANIELEEDTYILLSTAKEKLYIELKEELLLYVTDEKILDMGKHHGWKAKIWLRKKAEKYNMHNNDFVYQMQSHNVKWYLPLYDTEVIQKRIFLQDMYHEEELLYYTMNVFLNGGVRNKIHNGVVLDIGANIGNHALYYAKECGASTVLAFEPLEQNYAILEKNIALNQLEEIIKPYYCGVGESSGKAKIAAPLSIERLCATRLKESVDGNVDIIAIDDLKLDQVDLIKIDVEGFELNVIKGAINTIKEHVPYIMVEATDKDGNIYDIIKILTPMGYVWEQISVHDYIFFVLEK